MIANLMMYARPELEDAHLRFWNLIRQQLAVNSIETPTMLSQDAEEFSVWLNPQLVLSQTCGMPYRNRLHGKVQIVGTPDYGIVGCSPGYYRSPIVVHKNDPRESLSEFDNALFTYNQAFSQSGYAAAYEHVTAQHPWFKRLVQSGSHHGSAIAVAEKRADIASLDAMTWKLIQRYDHFADNLRVLEWTKPTPGLPLITSLRHDSSVIYQSVQAAINELTESDRELLSLRGLVHIATEEYLAVPNPPPIQATN